MRVSLSISDSSGGGPWNHMCYCIDPYGTSIPATYIPMGGALTDANRPPAHHVLQNVGGSPKPSGWGPWESLGSPMQK